MNRIPTVAISVAVLTVSLANGQSPQDVQRMIEAIFELDGSAEALRNARAVQEGELRSRRAQNDLSQELYEMHLRWVEVVFGNSEFTRDYIHGFAERFDRDFAQQTLEWLKTPLADKFRRMEEQDNRPDHYDELNAFLNSPEAEQISDARRELLRRDAEASGCADFRLDVMSIREMARMSVLNRFLPPKEQRSEEEMKKIVKEMREYKREGITNGCWWPSLYTYRNAGDAELEEYLSFHQTEAGAWHAEAHRAATVHAWRSAGRRLGAHGFIWPQELDWK